MKFDSLYSKDIQRKDHKSIINGFTIMAHNKGVKTWVKMLENEESIKIAEELNIDYLQGNFLAPLEKNYES